MVYENIELTEPTFCIGSQTGTFCSIDSSDINNVFLRVRNNMGTLIRSYQFIPTDTFYTNPGVFPYNVIVDLKYVGPKELSYFYTGALFYTLERVISGKISTGPYSSITYSDKCIIRRWVLDADSFVLNLDNTWIKSSDQDNYFDTFSISVEYLSLTFASSTTTETSFIEINDSSELNVGDVLILGPSSDMDNVGKVERAYIYSINNNELILRSFDGTTPTKYEYVVHDSITKLGSIYLFSNPRPLLGSSDTLVVNTGSGKEGTLVVSSQNVVINKYSYSTQDTISKSSKYIIVEDSSIFNIDDEILIHQTQDGSDASPGLYEYKIITNIIGNTLTFDTGLIYNYKSNIFNTLEAYVTQAIFVPNYTNVTIKGHASITCKKWDGYTGGIVVFRSTGVTYFEDNTLGIDVSSQGYRGGGDNGGGNNAPGDPGESYLGLGWHDNLSTSNCLSNATGGGGGYGPSNYGGTAGGGGGNFEEGGSATEYYSIPAIAQGGKAFVYELPKHLSFGGAGGGGGDDNQTPGICKGGDSGGLIIVYAKVIKNAVLNANGEKGTDAGSSSGGTGGGGSGGTIFVRAVTYSEKALSLSGGLGGVHPYEKGGNGSIGIKSVPSTEQARLIGFDDNGFLYRLDQTDYCRIIDKDENSKYVGVLASIWNTYTGGLSFVKASNYMTLDVNDNYEVIKSQVIRTLTKEYELLNVYALDYIGYDLYLLQKKCIKLGDDGAEAVVSWTSYNYIADTLLPYNYSTNIVTTQSILPQYTQIIVHIYVRDQFDNGVLGANVFFSTQGDPAAILDPINGYVVTDADGYCFVKYKVSSIYVGITTFRAKSDKGNINCGSAYTNTYYKVTQYLKFDTYCKVVSVDDVLATMFFKQIALPNATINFLTYSKYIFGYGHYFGKHIEYDYDTHLEGYFSKVFNLVEVYLLRAVHEPLKAGNFHIFDSLGKVPVALVNLLSKKCSGNTYLLSKGLTNELLLLNQMSASRHLRDLNKDQILAHQFIFIQDAEPAFWSEKVTVNTSIWIRMRPFAYSLNPNTLIFKVREKNSSLKIDTGFIDVTSLGVTTLYDAGGGMYGIDFFYQPLDFFKNESIIFMDILVYDKAPTPNILHIDYWFKIIDDYKGPIVYNIFPEEASIVPLNTVIEFYVKDLGIGLDIKDIEVFINNSKAYYSYTQVEENAYKIWYDTTDQFQYGSTISINVIAYDKSKHKNVSFAYWILYISNSTGPWVDVSQSEPHNCSRGINPRENNIKFQIYAIDNSGLDKTSIAIQMDNHNFTDAFELLPIIYNTTYKP